MVTPTILGIDEFSLARRHRYAPVLVDMATYTPVDVLDTHPGGDAGHVAQEHSGVLVPVRDRAGAFADAVALSADGEVGATTSQDGTVRLWAGSSWHLPAS